MQNTLLLTIIRHLLLRRNEQGKPQTSCHDTQQGSTQRLAEYNKSTTTLFGSKLEGDLIE